MKIYSASYNYPSGFLWGISPGKDFVSDPENYTWLFDLQETGIKAISICIPWAEYEPLKGNYDEKRIETARLLLTRIRNRNIEPVVMLDVGEIPHWQNLEKSGKKEGFIEERYKFSAHLIDAFATYAKYFAISFSYSSLSSGKHMQAELRMHKEICEYLHSISDKKLAGTAIPSIASARKKGGFRNLFGRIQLTALKSIETDFIAIHADNDSFKEVQSSLEGKKEPILFLSDGLKAAAPEQKSEILMDKLYDIWQIYQKGWHVLGLLSEIDIKAPSKEKELYAISSKNNAFEISTDNPYLPEKWVRFLKD